MRVFRLALFQPRYGNRCKQGVTWTIALGCRQRLDLKRRRYECMKEQVEKLIDTRRGMTLKTGRMTSRHPLYDGEEPAVQRRVNAATAIPQRAKAVTLR